MGLMNQLYTTYCAMEQKYVGNYAECAEPLVPISHQIINAELEITINAEGKFLSACSVGKEDAAIIIPVTEDSAAEKRRSLWEFRYLGDSSIKTFFRQWGHPGLLPTNAGRCGFFGKLRSPWSLPGHHR